MCNTLDIASWRKRNVNQRQKSEISILKIKINHVTATLFHNGLVDNKNAKDHRWYLSKYMALTIFLIYKIGYD